MKINYLIIVSCGRQQWTIDRHLLLG
uniref:Uncharacterized protein n=1 Tax=Arundo donax TaxID=35708 RepID=A0A0A9C2H8_ARUDO